MSLDGHDEDAQALYDEAPCGYVTTRADGVLLRCNATFLMLSGYAPDALVGKRRLQDLWTMPGRIYYETHIGPLLRMQGRVRDVSLELVCADERRLPVIVNATAVRDASGAIVAQRVTLFDASERRSYERELLAARRAAEHLARVVDLADDAIFTVDRTGVVLTWNSGAEQMFGYPRAEAIGQTVEDLIVPDHLRADYLRNMAMVAAGTDVRVETQRRHKSGRMVDISAHATIHSEALGEVDYVSTIIRDVTAERRLEAQVRRAEHLQTVGTLAGGVAHEINNQMTVVIGFGAFVKAGLPPTSPLAGDIDAMMEAAERGATISKQLLAFSRRQFLRLEPTDLGAFVSELASLLQERLAPGRTLTVEAHEPCRAQVDRSQLQRVLESLVTNANDAVTDDGQVSLSVRKTRLEPSDVTRFHTDELVAGDYIELVVADDGHGMNPATLARLFEPFFTTKEFGTSSGLGLPVVFGIMRQHDGQVRVESTPGSGTSVHLYLPAAP